MRPGETDSTDPNPDRAAAREEALAAVAEAASRLRFGAIQLTVHDGRIVQLDVTERQRFT